MRKTLLATLLLFICPLTAYAQRHEIAVTGGGYFTPSTTVSFDAGWAVEGSYAGRIVHLPLVSLYGELPLAWGFSGRPSNLPAAFSSDFHSFFVAPGVKLKLTPEFPVSPYFTVGVGAARFRSGGAEDTNTVVQYGAGVDFHVAPFIALRGEVRDYNSGTPVFGFGGGSGRQHNVFATGGIVLRF
jgi:hypothetical protein